MFEVCKQGVAQVAGWQTACLYAAAFSISDSAARCCCGTLACTSASGRENALPGIAARLHEKSVVQFGQREIETVRGTRPVAGRSAEAGVGRMRAMHGNQQQRRAARAVRRIGVCAGEEMLIVQAQRREIAGTHADDRQRLGRRRRLHKAQPALGIALCAPQGFLRSE